MGKNKVFFKMTYRQMMKNKVRTIVTIAGIILSVALITAISTFVSSLQNSMLQYKISENGDWHGAVLEIDSEKDLKKLLSEEKLDEAYLSFNLGYAYRGQEDRDVSYINVSALDKKFIENIPIEITSGRIAENSNEIVLVYNSINEKEASEYKLGSRIELPLGNLNKSDMTINGERTITYTIVGFCEMPSYSYWRYAYPAFTAYDEKTVAEYSTDVYFKMHNAKDVYDFIREYDNYTTDTNESVLRFMGTSKYSSYYSFVYSLAAIVIVLVVGGSILLIYNSFAISMNERSRQFGLLSSIGATRKQLRASVLYEAFLVSAVGIPLGIIVGIVGIGVTLYCIKGNLENIAASVISLGEMKLHVSAEAVCVAVVVSLVTVLLSAFIPMLRISRISAVDAIRQSGDIKLTKRKIKCSKLFMKVFGFEGMLGRKNFKRSRKKYRTTVISLFVSIVMFISASALGEYLVSSIEGIYKVGEYDIIYRTYLSDNNTKKTNIIDEMKNISYVTESGQAQCMYLQLIADTSYYTQEYISSRDKEAAIGYFDDTDTKEIREAYIYGIEDTIYEEYLKSNGLSVDYYMDTENPRYLMYSDYRKMDSITGKVQVVPVYKQEQKMMTFYQSDWEKYDELMEKYKSENPELYKNEGNLTPEQQKRYKEITDRAEEESREYINLNIDRVVDNVPYTVNTSSLFLNDIVLCPQSIMNTLSEGKEEKIVFYTFYKTTNNKAAEEEMKEILKRNNINYRYCLVNEAMEYESRRSMIFVIKVFSGGFFVLMSLIAMANVFNTISTNMLLRRREFAMLKSVGLTDKSFNKIMYYECFLYGSKALMFGIPVALAFVWWIYSSVNDLWVMSFKLPYQAIFICILSVYFIVFVTMVYSKKKIQKLNLIDCIREENV